MICDGLLVESIQIEIYSNLMMWISLLSILNINH